MFVKTVVSRGLLVFSFDFSNCLGYAGNDLVRVALRVWTAVFKVALVCVVLNEAVWNADGRTTVSNTPGELVDGLSFVEASEAEVVVWTVSSDVLVLVFFELVHELEEVFLTACVAHVVCGEVTVHTGAVPVAENWLTVPLNVDAILFAKAKKDVTSYPNLVACLVSTLTEDLEFPLPLCHFSIDAFVVDACVEADVEVLFYDLACDVANR